MKIKNVLLILVAMLGCLSCSARDQYSTDASVLPKAAATILSTHFPNVQVSHIKIDKDTFGVDGYDVVLNDGTEVDFDSKGNLKEVDCNHNGKVPDALVPQTIRSFVAGKYPNQNIIKLDVKRRGYEIELQSGLELVFNKQGVFQRIDD